MQPQSFSRAIHLIKEDWIAIILSSYPSFSWLLGLALETLRPEWESLGFVGQASGMREENPAPQDQTPASVFSVEEMELLQAQTSPATYLIGTQHWGMFTLI